MFDLCRILPKHLKKIYHKNTVLIIGLTDQSDYIICHFMVGLFICTVYIFTFKGAIHIIKYNACRRCKKRGQTDKKIGLFVKVPMKTNTRRTIPQKHWFF